ncbi:conserved exported hypothetical protein [Flavobacterium sp. 9AF]|uniref:hypothetical protein n=1 Tax=Flavobacterium sp. 9AF TaxID=2653142 RepID=UPI0012F1E87C|nr:hypothetical protein [Flavobacterium sp. 9AF]VXB80969.1 conserved exported hypothetical protein [Flavobacterium sp. 9AF]
MKKLKIKFVAILMTLSFYQLNFAQETKTNEKTKLSFEVDPATFLFNGYSFHIRLQPKGCEHLLIGLGTYSMDLPDLIVNFNKKNKDEGWDVKINQGYSLFAEQHLTEVNNKWFIGTQIGIQEFKIEKNNTLGSTKFTNILTMGYFGYTIRPLKNNFYIKPWLGIGYTSKLSGNNNIAMTEFDIAPITMFATFHIGYTF